ncbi:hypothetical protein AA23498_2520 [Acetobacter nitrogenifigens DSM 23921 = NBRC 105050]|nr:hypothetical protein AA23498_2520 [Acetobacter nitrogenifigens DSM 23921 = NBRC 105050]
MRRNRYDKTIEKSTSSASAFSKQPIHLRREPDGGQIFRNRVAITRWRAIQQKLASAIPGGFLPDADFKSTTLIFKRCGDTPSRRHKVDVIRNSAPQIAGLCATKTTPRRQQR